MKKKAFSLVEFLVVLIIIGLLYVAMADKIKEWIGILEEAKVSSITSSLKTSLQNIQTNYIATRKVDLKSNVEFKGFYILEEKDELIEFSNDKNLIIKFQKHYIDNKHGVLVTLESKDYELLQEFSTNLNKPISNDNKTVEFRVNFDESVAR